MMGVWVGGGGLFDFRVTPNSNFMLDVNLDVEFDNKNLIQNTKIAIFIHSSRYPVN